MRSPRAVGDPPRLPIDDTVLDLCDTRLGETDQPPIHWLSLAVQNRLSTPDRLRRALSRRTRLGGRQEIFDLLGDVSAGAVSPLELRYLRDVERAHGLPTGVRQARGLRGVLRDVLYANYGLIVELDGQLGHSGRGRFRDFQRDNAALLAGEVTLRFGWDDVTGAPCDVARQVAELLIRAGWPGLPGTCRRCQRQRAV